MPGSLREVERHRERMAKERGADLLWTGILIQHQNQQSRGKKKRNWKGEQDDRSFLLQEAFQPNLNSVIILPETLLSYTGLCLRAALWNHPTFTGFLGTAVQTSTNESSFTVCLPLALMQVTDREHIHLVSQCVWSLQFVWFLPYIWYCKNHNS